MPSRSETDQDKRPAFAPDTALIREAAWTVASDASAEPVTIRVDSLAAIFGLEEQLHAERAAAVTLELDPDGYLFSYIQTFSDRPECVLPDRADITYATHCLRSFARHALDVAARRGAEVAASPDDVPGLFTAADEPIVAEDLLQVPRGRITEQGMRQNIRRVLTGVAELLAGMEPASSRGAIELCRAQLWQWVHHDTGVLDTGRIITLELFRNMLEEELGAAKASEKSPAAPRLDRVAALLDAMTAAPELADSLLDEAYRPDD